MPYPRPAMLSCGSHPTRVGTLAYVMGRRRRISKAHSYAFLHRRMRGKNTGEARRRSVTMLRQAVTLREEEGSMSVGKSAIQWCDATWNPLRGCSRVSTGCEACYAEKQAGRFSGPGQPYEG